jgi:hypothetical protein
MTTIPPSPEILIPHIRAAAIRNVSPKRHDVQDIARILYEHGAMSAGALHAVQRRIAEHITPANYDVVRVRAINRQLSELAARGYGAGEYSQTLRRGGPWDEVGALVAELETLHQDTDRQSQEVEEALQAWLTVHHEAICALCELEARALLTARACKG